MRMGIVLGVLGLGSFLATGCGQKYWYQEGKTFDECKADRAACRAELLKRTDQGPIGDYQRRFTKACMQQKGYRLVPEKKLPLAVKRHGLHLPGEPSLSRGYGVAGSLKEQ